MEMERRRVVTVLAIYVKFSIMPHLLALIELYIFWLMLYLQCMNNKWVTYYEIYVRVFCVVF